MLAIGVIGDIFPVNMEDILYGSSVANVQKLFLSNSAF